MPRLNDIGVVQAVKDASRQLGALLHGELEHFMENRVDDHARVYCASLLRAIARHGSSVASSSPGGGIGPGPGAAGGAGGVQASASTARSRGAPM